MMHTKEPKTEHHGSLKEHLAHEKAQHAHHEGHVEKQMNKHKETHYQK